MILKDVFRTPSTNYEKEVVKEADEIFKGFFMNFFRSVSGQGFKPNLILKEYFTNEDSSFNRLDSLWCKVGHNKVLSKRSNRIFISSLYNYKITDFIQDEFHFTVKPTNSRMDYSYDKFFKLSMMEIALLLTKYNNEVFEFEVKTAIVRTLFTYFKIYSTAILYNGIETPVWNINDDDLINVINLIKEMDLSEFIKYKNKSPQLMKESPQMIIEEHIEDINKKRHRPTSLEECQHLFSPDMSQSEKAEVFMHYYGYNTIGTARKALNKLGDKRKYVKKVVEDAKDEILNNIITSNDIITNTIKEENDETKNEIRDLKVLVQVLSTEITSLRSEMKFMKEILNDKNEEVNKYKNIIRTYLPNVII